jgi:NitT/TauT family transport system substrate-binding protein
MADTRTTEGADKVFGGTMSAAVAYLKRDFVEKNPNTVQALVNAFYKTLKWIDKATPEQIADNVPQEYWLGDKPLYIAAVKANLQIYSRDGIVSEGSQQRSVGFLKQFDKEMAAATLDPPKTFDGRFVKNAAETIK